MLSDDSFKTIIKNTPLVSVDLCLVSQKKLLLCKRNNEPLKGIWFTPGGRIFKNETWQNSLLRIAKSELGLKDVSLDSFRLMGIWDHFYNNSAIDEDTSTHYVNLPHYALFDQCPVITLDSQHGEFEWFDLSVVANDSFFHSYMRGYAKWLISKVDGSCE
jgi:colanic acid biosynthesis protein WcaH